MKIRIIRCEQSSHGAIGVMTMDGQIFCFTLQPDAAEVNRFCIHAGTYPCRRFHGTKWRNTFEIIVPGHTALLFHAGNVEEESLGCILLGATTGKLKGQRAVLNSGGTFQAFLDATKNVNDFKLEIIDQY